MKKQYWTNLGNFIKVMQKALIEEDTLSHQHKHHPTQHISNTIVSIEKAFQGKITAAKQIFESDLINTYTSTNNNRTFIRISQIHHKV